MKIEPHLENCTFIFLVEFFYTSAHLALPLVLLVSEMNAKALTRMERKVKGGGRRESLSKNWIPVLARAYLETVGVGRHRI